MALFVIANSGEYCAESGVWVSNGPLAERRLFSQGEEFPALNGKPTKWRLLIIFD